MFAAAYQAVLCINGHVTPHSRISGACKKIKDLKDLKCTPVLSFF